MLPHSNLFRFILLLSIFLAPLACEHRGSATAGATQPTTAKARARVVSLSPAVTELIVAMDAGSQLVGVSTFDVDASISALPRVGDYENTNWEKIAEIAPGVMIVQGDPGRVNETTRARAAELGITLVNVKIDDVADVIISADQIGAAIGAPEKAQALIKSLRDELEDVRLKHLDESKVRAVIVTSDEGAGVAGPGTFLDDLLQLAGGQNVVPAARKGYTTIDRELLLEWNPDVVIHLLPGATPQRQAQAERYWASLPELTAVKNGKIVYLTEPWVLMPGAKVGKLAGAMSEGLHRK